MKTNTDVSKALASKLSPVALAVAMTVPALSNIAVAQEAEATEEQQFEAITVTATKRPQVIYEVPIAISAFDGDKLAAQGITDLTDVGKFVPNLNVTGFSAGHTSSVNPFIRGIGLQDHLITTDPGVSVYVDGVYLGRQVGQNWSLNNIERIEVLRGPQGTLYGRNAVGGAINILYKQPTDYFEGSVRGIVGNFGTQEYYGAFSGPLIEDKLLGRVNFAYRDREGVIEEVGPTEDLDGLGTENIAVQLQWTPTDNLTVDIRQNWMDIDRPFGGANGGGLVVLNEDGTPGRSTDLIPGFRFIDRTQTNPLANDFFNPDQQARFFTNPTTGVSAEAQPNRAGLDYADFDGFQNAVASLDGFNETSDASLAAHNRCVFPGDIDGDSICAASNGLNREQFDQQGTQLDVTWDATENLSIKYIYGFNQLSYQRTTDDDNTSSQFHDRQFYVNHEADYSSHELQAFWDITDNFSITVGGFIYDATIDQRGDFYSSVFESRFVDGYNYNPSVSLGATGAGATGLPVGLPVSALLAPTANVGLFTAKNNCLVANPSQTCARNYSVNNSAENLTLNDQTRNDNLVVGLWEGDDGSDSNLNVINGINSVGSDLLYATQTEREATAVYTQGVWNISEKFALTVGLRYAVDDVTAEENLFRYTETFGTNDVLARFVTDNFTAANDLSAALYALNAANGGFALDANGDVSVDQYGQPIPTQSVVNAGFPIAVSVYRPFQRDDEKLTGRINLDWDVSEEVRLYFSATSGYRSGGYNLVFFSNTAAYDLSLIHI